MVNPDQRVHRAGGGRSRENRLGSLAGTREDVFGTTSFTRVEAKDEPCLGLSSGE